MLDRYFELANQKQRADQVGAPFPQPDVPSSPTHEVTRMITNQLNHLSEVIGVLHDKLSPVLRKDTNPVPSEALPLDEGASRLVSVLTDIHNDLCGKKSAIQALIDRLEI